MARKTDDSGRAGPPYTLPAAFILYRSPLACVRVEPPDDVVIEIAGDAAHRFSRRHVTSLRPMMISVCRGELGDPHAFPETPPDDIVIDIQTDGRRLAWLGPFDRKAGLAIGHALERASAELLFASADLAVVAEMRVDAVHVDWVEPPDGDFSTCVSFMSMPIRASVITGVTIQHGDERALRHGRHLGMARPSAARFAHAGIKAHWVELAMRSEPPWLIGPLSREDAEIAARGVGAWLSAHPRDTGILEVAEQELLATPHRFHGRRIRTVSVWTLAFERSEIAGVWMEAPQGIEVTQTRSRTRVRVTGTWVYPQGGAFGHLGGFPGELLAETIEPLLE